MLFWPHPAQPARVVFGLLVDGGELVTEATKPPGMLLMFHRWAITQPVMPPWTAVLRPAVIPVVLAVVVQDHVSGQILPEV